MSLTANELKLLNGLPAFSSSRGGFDFVENDYENDPKVARFGDPAKNDFVGAAITNGEEVPITLGALDKSKHPEIKTFYMNVMHNGQSIAQEIWVKDGDSLGVVAGSDGPIATESRDPFPDTMETAKFKHDGEKVEGGELAYYQDKDGKLLVRKSDPIANVQSRIYEGILENAEKNGFTIEATTLGYDGTGRPLLKLKATSPDGDVIDLTELRIKTGAAKLHHTVWANADKDQRSYYSKLRNMQENASSKGLGVHDITIKNKIKVFEDSKQNIPNLLYNHLSSLKPKFNNKRLTNKQLDKQFIESSDMVKIGDVWLNIPPTHIVIAQARSSQAIPIIGMESRPVTTPITNRTVIKLNLIFEGEDQINDNLSRILQQFKYVPINLIRSKDIFGKLETENTFLRAYEKSKEYCIPVTMDGYTLYTIEGHPSCLGLSIEMSLFNPLPYFHNNAAEKVQYIRYDESIYESLNTGDIAKTKETVRIKANEEDIKKLFEPTVNLEDSIHPYNFLIEHERTENVYDMDPDDPSKIIIIKIDSTFSDKLFELTAQAGFHKFTDEDVIQKAAIGRIDEVAHSISISYNNNFAWVPVIQYAVPTAQFLGHGETRVSINIKTSNTRTIRDVLKSYSDYITPDRYGNFESRYLLKSSILDLANCNILTMQNLAISSIEGKPNLSDVNIIFTKTNFESINNPDNEPVKFDKYWGLNRITSLLDNEEVKQMVYKAESAQKNDSILFRIKNSGSVDILGMPPGFVGELNSAFEDINSIKAGETRQEGKVIKTIQKIDPKAVKIGTYRNAAGSEIINKFKWVQGKIKEGINQGGLNSEFINRMMSSFEIIQKKYENDPALMSAALDSRDRSGWNNRNANRNADMYKASVGLQRDLKNAVVRSSSEELNYNIIIKDFNKYWMAYKGYCAIFDLEGITKDEFEMIKSKFRVRGFNIASDPTNIYRITVSKMPNKVNNAVYNSKKEIDKVLNEKELAYALDSDKLIAKPWAAHRWFNRIDNFIAYNKIFSQTVGYWYSHSKLRDMKDEISAIEDHAAKNTTDYLQDRDAAQSVYMQETFRGFVDDWRNKEYSFLNTARAFAFPTSKKDITSYTENSRNPSNKGVIYAILNKNNEPLSRDYPLSNFSTALMNKSTFSGDPSIVEYVNTWGTNNTNKIMDFKPQAELYSQTGAKITKVYDKNNKEMGVIGADGALYRPSDRVMSDIHPLFASHRIDKRLENRSRGLFQYQMHVKTDNSILGASDAYAATPETKAIPASVKLQGTHTNPMTGKQAESPNVKIVGDITVDDATKNALVHKFYDSELPTIGIQNAFPTYKIYIIHDNLNEYKYKSLDDYWDFRLLQDLIVIRDKNNPAHILKARIVIDPKKISTSAMGDSQYGFKGAQQENGSPLNMREMINQDDLSTVNTEEAYSVMGGRSPLRQGMRVCIKLGYHTDPRFLDTVFIGTITNLQGAGLGMYELEARGDGRELVVPVSVQNASLTGSTFSDLVSQILKSNPAVAHFGKMYGSHLEKLSRKHHNLFNFVMNRMRVSNLVGAGTVALSAGGIAAGKLAASAGVGLLSTGPLAIGAAAFGGAGLFWAFRPWGDDAGRLAESLTLHYFHQRSNYLQDRAKHSFGFDAIMSRLKGDVYNADKASSQLMWHVQDVFSNGHDPVDANIFAFDIWASGCGSNVNFKANSQKTIWDVLRDIQRVYPGYALDVRPYGSRSTIFFGDPGFDYFRTDDPLLAMAPSFIEMDNLMRKANSGDRYAQAIAEMTPKRDILGNIDLNKSENGVIPMVPFMKHHVATSWDNIIINGIKGTPERGWNSVVISKTADGSGETEEYTADADLFSYALRRKFTVVDWTDDARLSQYYALGLLKEGVERLYGGTLVLKGNPKIEPYDKVYVCDKVNEMYGWIQVETVIHKFDNEMGFTTHIVPNMVCSVNDSSYQTTGDVRKKMLTSMVSNYISERGSLGLALDAGTLLLGATGIGLMPTLFIALAGETALQWAKRRNLDEKYNHAGIPTETIDNLNTANWIGNAVELKYGLIKDTAGYYTGSLARTISGGSELDSLTAQGVKDNLKASAKGAGKATLATGRAIVKVPVATTRYLFSDIFYQAIKTLYSRTKGQWSGEFWKSVASPVTNRSVPTSVKTWGENLYKQLSKAEESVRLQALEAAKASRAAAAASTGIKDGAKAGGKAALEESKKLGANAKNAIMTDKNKAILKKLGKHASALLVLYSMTELLSVAETFAVKSATKGNIIIISPLWHKDSLLMPGLEGYRNNDTWMHIKGMYLNAKEAWGEAKDSLKNWDAVKLISDFVDPAGIGGNSAFAAVPSGDYVPPRLNNVAEAIKSPIFNSMNPIILKYCRLYNVDPFLVYAIIQHESTWKIDAVNVNGPGSIDRGLMQINSYYHGPNSTFDPERNIRYGIELLSSNLSRHRNEFNAIRAYNGGLDNPVTEKYARTILAYRDEFKRKLTGGT